MNQRGMTLVSAMMSIAVSAVALLATFRLVDMAVEVFATLQGTVRAVDTVHEIRFAIGQANICTLNFNDVTLSGVPVQVMRKLFYPNPANPTQKSQLEIGIPDSEGTIVRITGLTMRRDSQNTSLAYLDIDMNRTRGPAALPLKKRSIPIVVKTDATNKITCCSSMEVDTCPPDPAPAGPATLTVFPRGCGGNACACGGVAGPTDDCGDDPPVSTNAICVAKGYKTATGYKLVAVGFNVICDPNGSNCRAVGAGCNACEEVTCN